MTAHPHQLRLESSELEETHTLGSSVYRATARHGYVLVLSGVIRVTGHRDLRDNCPGPSPVSPGPRSTLQLKSGGDRCANRGHW